MCLYECMSPFLLGKYLGQLKFWEHTKGSEFESPGSPHSVTPQSALTSSLPPLEFNSKA